MAERFFGNMTDEEYEEWKSLSQEEKVAMARELAIEKRKAKKIKEAEDSAYWKNYRKKAMTTEHGSISDEPHFEETYSADSPYATLAKAKADEYLGLSEKTISRGPQNMGDYVSNAWDSFDLGDTLKDLGLSKDLKEELEKDAHKNRIITEEDHDEAKALREDRLTAEEFPEVVEDPRVVAPTDTLMSKFQDHLKKKTPLTRGLEDRTQTDEFADAQKTTFDDEGNVLTLSPEDAEMESIREGIAGNTAMVADEAAMEASMRSPGHPLNTDSEAPPEEGMSLYNKAKLAGGAAVKLYLDTNPWLSKEKKNKLLDSIVPPLELKNKKKVESLINTSKKDVEKEIGGKLDGELGGDKKKTTGDFVKFDENGYPVYKKGSGWAKSFNDAFAKSLEQEGNKTFSWTGHDGKSRSYTNKRATKTIEKAPESVVKKPTSVDKKEYDPTVLMPQISKYKEAKTPKDKERVLTEFEKNYLTVKEKKNVRAIVKEESQEKGEDEYWIDPRTGFALNLSAIDRRIDRADLMKMAALFPPADRAAFLYSKKAIDKPDFDAIVKTSEQKRALDVMLKKVQIKEAQLKVVALERKNALDPERKEMLKLYEISVTQDDFDMQILLGEKLGFPKDVLKLTTDNRRRHEKEKLRGKGVDGFKNKFFLPYSKVSDKKDGWIKRASSIVQTTGVIDAIGLDGKKYVDRRGYFRSFGLFEQEAMKKKGNKGELLSKMPFYQRIKSDPKFFGSDNKFSPSIFVNDSIAYEKHLMDGLVYMGMDKTYTGRWSDMLAYISSQERPDELTRILSAE